MNMEYMTLGLVVLLTACGDGSWRLHVDIWNSTPE